MTETSSMLNTIKDNQKPIHYGTRKEEECFYHKKGKKRALKCESPHKCSKLLVPKKLIWRRAIVLTLNLCNYPSKLLFLTINGIKCLIDTGSQRSILPTSFTPDPDKVVFHQLIAANGAPVQWVFIVADVGYGIIRADFLSHFKFRVNIELGDSFTVPCFSVKKMNFANDPVMESTMRYVLQELLASSVRVVLPLRRKKLLERRYRSYSQQESSCDKSPNGRQL
ncbi:unnamed protein product [Lepeophtheirus salmonis]|uniref:(salmon louse) hypothetical protein n=1 Tax=Lepeophtheirus salmonis TaxID=72036 RepID=A0A7R8CMH5_LEPSM|nr:unnamed protein product [Lepeophtheirus salmonis]CAF2837601.1 unnamed protein product [Lepeophtheirus salmonis]